MNACLPYRELAPEPHEFIDWPDAFGTRFTVFADVEEEFDWSEPLDGAHRSTTAMAAFPEAHRRFADRGVGLACMVDHPIATDGAACDILRRAMEDGRSSIGAQLHSWVNPPFADGDEGSYPGNLPRALEAAKLDALSDAIAQAFGERPCVYRAGRYGIGPNTRALLAECGYRIDSSVRSRYDYRRDGGPNFTAIGADAYRRGGVLELPLTTVFTGRLRRAGPRSFPTLSRVPYAGGALARSGMLSRVALTPEDMPIAAALEAATVAIGEGVRLLVLSFHSPSLALGHTPYVRDAADLGAFHRWWDAMFARLSSLGAIDASIPEILAAAPPE